MPIVSLDHLTLFELTPPELVGVAGAAGFTHVGLRLNPAAPPGERQHPMLGDSPMRRETLARLRDTGVQVFDFGVFRLKRRRDVAAFEPVLETAAVLGARTPCVNGDEPDPQALADLLRGLCELGARYGVRMHLEPTPWTGIPTLAAALHVVALCGHPSARMMIDTIHADRSGATLADLAAVPPALIDYVQVCDAIGPASRRLRDDDPPGTQRARVSGRGQPRPGRHALRASRRRAAQPRSAGAIARGPPDARRARDARTQRR